MNQEENTNTVILNEQQIVEQTQNNENAELRKYYFYHQLLMNPSSTPVLSENTWLFSFRRRTVRFIEMLSLLEHSCVDEIPILQKACFSYLIEDTVPRKEREQIIEAWTSWSDFLFSLNRYRGLASFFLQYHQRILKEIESLLYPATPEAPSELQEIHQEGGI